MKTNLDYVNSYYKVNCKVGQKVTYQGKHGTIVHGMGHYVGVVMDGDKATNVLPYHPKDLEYLQEFTEPPRPTKAQQRYQDYLHCECNESFGEYLKYGWYKKGGGNG